MTVTKFSLPDKTIFHGADSPNGYSYKQARKLKSTNGKIKHLRLRLEGYFISGLEKVEHPFLVAILICVGVEVLGQVMLGTKDNGESKETNTIEIYKKLDPKLAAPLSEKFKDEYNRRRFYPSNSAGCTGNFSCYAYVLRKGLRNSFTHNYRSLGVKLGDAPGVVEVDERTGMLVLNPVKYKESFVNLFNQMFNDIQNGTNTTNLNNALKYFDILISKI